MRRIYLDYAATTPLLPEVYQKIVSLGTKEFGNPSSLYLEGRRAKESIDVAREILSESLGCLFGEVIFTSSGTEAANMALIGTALANKTPGRNRILMGAAEHHCVLGTQKVLERLGYQVELIPVTKEARIDLDAYEKMLGPDVLITGLMHANNELGTINPIQRCAKKAHEQGALFYSDTVQTFLMPLGPEQKRWNIDDLGVDLLSVSSHKVYGPKGVGALYIRSGTPFEPLIYGGGQEREMRGGTENVAGIVGFAEAIKTLMKTEGIWEKKVAAREAFIETLTKESAIQFIYSVENFNDVLPGHLHLRFPGISAESLLILIDRLGVCASSGAACSSGSIEPSHVLLASGYTKEEAGEGMRFTFGLDTCLEDAHESAQRVALAANQMKR